MNIVEEIRDAVTCPQNTFNTKVEDLYKLTYAQRSIWALRLIQDVERVVGDIYPLDVAGRHAGVKGYDIKYAAYVEYQVGFELMQEMLLTGNFTYSGKTYTSIRTLYWVLNKEQAEKAEYKPVGNIEMDFVNNKSLVEVILDKLNKLFTNKKVKDRK